MSSAKNWIQAMRLRTLPLSISGILMGSAAALLYGAWNNVIFSFALCTTVLFQIVSNLANDLGDSIKGTDNANRLGPLRSVQDGSISRKSMRNAIVFTSILALFSAAFLIYCSIDGMSRNLLIIYSTLALLSVAAAIAYTIGKNAYGYLGLGDLMVLIFFGFVSVIGVFGLYSKQFDLLIVLPALTIGLLSMAVLNLNNMRDFKNDKACRKNTLVVKIGPTNAKFYHAALIFFALFSLAIFIAKMNEPLLFLSCVPGLILIVHLRKVMQATDPKSFDPELKTVALSTFAIGLIFLLISMYSVWWSN